LAKRIRLQIQTWMNSILFILTIHVN